MSDASVRAIDGRAVVQVGGSELLAPLVAAAASSRDLAAGSAASAAVDAGKASQSAALSQTAALTAPNVYADEASGRAAVADGRTFWTDLGVAGLGLYRRTSSSASTLLSKIITGAMLASSSGSALIGYSIAAVGSIVRPVQSVLRDQAFNPKDFGALGTGARTAAEHTGFNAALGAAKNPNDAYFSSSVLIAPGDYRFTASIDLPASFSFLEAGNGSVLWGAGGMPVLQANGVSYVRSSIQGVRTYGGSDALRIGTLGEVASLTITDCTLGAYSGTGLYSSAGSLAGMTSCKITRVYVDGGASTNGYGLICEGGINNNNLVADSDFGNVKNDVVRVQNQANGWQFRNVRIEAGGQAGKAQYHLERPVGNHIIGGWSEGSHEYLARTTAQDDPLAFGLLIDGLVSIGSSNGSGFVGSKFDTGANRIVIGTNAWLQPTTAPAVCFIYGVNRNLRTNQSLVFTRDTGVSAQLTTPLKTVTGSTRRITITLTRISARESTANQQLARLRINALLVGLNGAGSYVDGAVDWDVSVRGNSAAIGTPRIAKRDELDGYSAAGVTMACTASAPSQGSVQIFVDATGLHPTLESGLLLEISATSVGLLDDDRFVVSIS